MYDHKHHDFDVCVVGGGMAGMCAAIAAARHGAETAIVQDRPVFGGNASSEIRMHICGAHGAQNKEAGILEELQLENSYRNPSGNYSIWDNVLYQMIAFQPHLTKFMNTTCIGCETEGGGADKRIASIKCWTLSSQTVHTIGAKVFIDCSGDSVLAPASGAAYRRGREARSEFNESIEPTVGDDKTMGNSILLQIRKTDSPQPFIAPKWAYRFESPKDLPNRIRGLSGGNFWWIELGGLSDTIGDAEEIRDRLLKAAWGVWDYIKNRAPEKKQAENWALEWLGSVPGKRENRRYEGDHILNQNEVRAGGKFKDIVAYGGWSMDDHHPAGLLYPGNPTIFHPAPSPYGIPYRSMYSRNVRNLMFAGRNISVTHAALSSTRVMATCSTIGQAVGTAAALSVALGLSPRNVYPQHTERLQHLLMADDCWLPGLERPVDPLTKMAKLNTDAPVNNGHDRPIGDAINAWDGKVGEALTLTWDRPMDVEALRLVFDSNLKDKKRMPFSFPRPGNRSLVPKSMVKAFRVEARGDDGKWATLHKEANNYQRLVVVPCDVRARAIRFVAEETWGYKRVRLFGCEALREDPQRLPTVPEGEKWSDVVKLVDPKDLAPPETGRDKEGHGSRHGA